MIEMGGIVGMDPTPKVGLVVSGQVITTTSAGTTSDRNRGLVDADVAEWVAIILWDEHGCELTFFWHILRHPTTPVDGGVA